MAGELKYLVITGAAGFIGSRFASFVAGRHSFPLVLVDRFGDEKKAVNESGLPAALRIDRDEFPEWLAENASEVEAVFHLGARTDTTEMNFRVLDSLNLSYSKQLWEICSTHDIPFFYASSAATYGAGEHGFSDDPELIPLLKPLNPYGLSKQLFDMYVLESVKKPSCWAGFKFFNVFGYGEQHKGRMASVVFHAWKQLKSRGYVELFKSHHPDYADGGQLRDFYSVEDLMYYLLFFLENRPVSGIYNSGSGTASSFLDLVRPVFKSMNLKEDIRFIDIPSDILDKYQYYTCADMNRIRNIGFKRPSAPLAEAVGLYISRLELNLMD